ncbi:S-adenosyl-L-methionine-dependent methyltransferase [Dichomitus squalens]|uniref:S-adenosyl-L-methionine-dependent methyltransferase n=1 Tax=Dichomitus squalens (strain LYAD-421) TaxID=732165 RepID=R7SRN8_DICSQ|nr:S-adenosyl-L-methionine-dependent methyltransferase [Dichomitus squalens LYAD-421 SS1]EJF58849.1 S-adenosyl-L-methionine-dependent methyltransferase [Dichomitus squalens LYAD-421 SS1]TBU46277.1 S-adenosyl-L-methionine-dependent methyltransferase [Dichomitus squalens]
MRILCHLSALAPVHTQPIVFPSRFLTWTGKAWLPRTTSHDPSCPCPGESLSVAESNGKKWVIVTPLSLPGERIRARVYRHSRLHSHADLVEVVQSNSEWRDMSRVQCRYFGKCAGCQYQMLSYEKQLDLKRDTVVEAYKNYSSIPPELVPPIQPTIGSPLQYGYRTKLTPHFQRPPFSFQKSQKRGEAPVVEGKPDWLKIGFHEVGTRHVMDIEGCPIATPVINKALGPVRDNVIKNIAKFKNGATLLLRDSLAIESSRDDEPVASGSTTTEDGHICVTDQKGSVRERVGDMFFEYTAGTFFQNNNSALVPLTSYVRDAAFPATDASEGAAKPTHLVDAYCGSGLFSIMLAPHFDKVAGIELSAESIRAAQRNAELNALSTEKVSFMAGDAANIFETVQEFPRDRTVLIIDPPRKGTDDRFIEQMVAFGASTVVYVSCNVHTQARDVGRMLKRSDDKAQAEGGKKYVLESLRGLDLFPQTAHVEAIAVLRLM